MIGIQLRAWDDTKTCQKNILYKISRSQTVIFTESHGEQSERVQLEYCLSGQQYGIYGHEYRGQLTVKEHCKAPDILACVVDESGKTVYSTICDVKSNISAFSDDLSKGNAMLTAIKEVRDFIEQIHDGLLHKNSFMLYYRDGGFQEHERLGIITKSFEPEKFCAVAALLERLVKEGNSKIPSLVEHKLKTNLLPYLGEIEKIRNFADKKIIISEKTYPLHIFLLEETGVSEFAATIKIDVPSKAALCSAI